MNQMIETMLNHRSIRKFKEEPVSEEHLELVLKAAQAAPTSSFLQAYSIIQVSQGEVRDKLMACCDNQSYVGSAPVFLVFCADLYRLHQMSQYHQSPFESGWTESFIIGTVDAALAGQNAMIAAEALGLGGVYIGGIRNKIEEVSELLKLPEEVYPVFGLCLGYPDQDPIVKERLPKEIMVHKECYTPTGLDNEDLKAYDERIRVYYTERTKGKVTASWSEQVAEKFKKETRPQVGPYLKRQKLMER